MPWPSPAAPACASFTCAWFDDRHYFEFYPLHVVHKRGTQRRYR
jgi:hypothetical protein